MRIEDILGYLQCPDDAGELYRGEHSLSCARCGRVFEEVGPGVFDLLPLQPNPRALDCLCSAHREAYLKEFEQPIRLDDPSLPWGAVEGAPTEWALRKRRQVEWILPIALAQESGENLVLCDVSAGSGYYTLRFAADFKYVLHCDLSAQSISYGKRRADQAGLQNVLFCRTDYLSLPFKSLDRIICMDTMIRGTLHEQTLMKAISASLSPTGTAVVDFHNWWHNPFRRMGLLPENFYNNRSYSKSEAYGVIRGSGMGQCEYFPYDESCGSPESLTGLLRRVLPPTRLTFRVAR